MSHDIYDVAQIQVPGARWGLQGYVSSTEEITNFLRLNSTPAQTQYLASSYGGAPVVTAIEYALAVSPRPPGVTMRVDPHLRSAHVGERFSVSLRVDATATGVDQVHASLGFDPQILTIVDALGKPADRIEPSDAFPGTISNTVDNTAGTIDFVTQQRSSPIQGSFTVATVRLKAKAKSPDPGTALLFLRRPGHSTAAFSGGVPVLTDLGHGSALIRGATATLDGTVPLQGRPTPPHASWKGPLSVTLYRQGSAALLQTFGVETDNRGRFTLSGIDADVYDIVTKSPHTLAIVRRGVTLVSGDNAIDMGTLLEGDADDDNVVGVADASILAASFGFGVGHPSYSATADLNADGVVNMSDQSLLQANFGKSGEQVVAMAPVRPSASSPSVEVRALAGAEGVGLRLEPDLAIVEPGQIVTLHIMLEAGTQTVDALAAHLDFAPSRLVVVDEHGAPTDRIVARASLAPLANSVDQAAGTIDFAGMSGQNPPLSGRVVVAEIRLLLKEAASGPGWVRFSTNEPRETGVFSGGEAVLGTLHAGLVVLSGEGSTVHLPFVLQD